MFFISEQLCCDSVACCYMLLSCLSVYVSVVFASVGAIFCESGHGLGFYCLSCFCLLMFLLETRLLVLVVSIFVFGVVGVVVVVVSLLLSLSIVC